jgi:hypothetical protein
MTDSVLKTIIGTAPFTPEEFLNDRDKLKRPIIDEIVAFRKWCDFKIQITSAYRTTGSHSTGLAIDFLAWDDWKVSQPKYDELWRKVTTYPFLGVGIYNDWNDGIGIHVDVIRKERQRPLRWIRKDGVYYYQSLQSGLFYSEIEFVTLDEVFG